MFDDVTAELLQRGARVRFRAIGESMQPTIEDGELIAVEPVSPSVIRRGDILLYRGDGGVRIHRVIGISRSERNHSFRLCGDASVSSDTPIEATQILGRVVAVERRGQSRTLDTRLVTLFGLMRLWVDRLVSAIGLTPARTP
jgi:signal peptidase I